MVRLSDIDCEPLFSSAVLKLKLRFATPADAGLRLQIHCYTSGWRFVVASERVLSLSCRSVSFRLHPDKIWLAGAYRAVLSCDGEPYACLDFQYEGRVKTSCGCRPLAEDEDARWIVGHLEQVRDNNWGYIREFNGLSAVLPRLVGLSRMNGFNRLCRQQGMHELRLNACLALTAPSLLESRRLACLLPDFLEWEEAERVQIDCSDREKWATDAVYETFSTGKTSSSLSIICRL